MSEVSVIGLGNMGSALARALVEDGRTVRVWNRRAEKAASLVAKGAQLAVDVAEAVASSPVVFVCVTNYATAMHILSESGADFSGKLLVQFTTGTPQDARMGEAWARQHGAGFISGAITGGPSSIGTPDAQILYSGNETAFRKAKPLLRALGGKLDYKGEQIGLASAWDMVLIMRFYGMFISLFHSVQICQAECIPLEQFIAWLGEQGMGYEKWLCENIQASSYQETSAPLELWAGGIRGIAQHAQDSRINAEFVMLVSRLFQEAMDAGYGREEVSALYKVLG